MDERRRSWWGWGWADEALPDDVALRLGRALADRLGLTELTLAQPPDPAALAALCSDDPTDRAAHTYGQSYRDVIRSLRGELDDPPDLVVRPTDEADVTAVLDWCGSAGVAVVPFGGGTSVVGGVETAIPERDAVVTLDLTRLDRVLEMDDVSRAARIQAGTYGPRLEDQLRPHGYTLRHFPQSFEFSTLGGWLATRAGGHYASVYTHIDDLTESIRMVTPTGVWESRRLPGSGAGPSPDRAVLGSEGTLGVITEAWMRVQDRPRWKASAGVRFAELADAADAVRALSQSALFPTNCRLLDPGEALQAAVDDGSSLLVLGFESADHPVGPWMDRAVELVSDHGGSVPDGVRLTGPDDAAAAGTDGAVGAWRSSFIRVPYGRDAMARMSIIAETFETACTWDRFGELHSAVTSNVERSLTEICGNGWVTCRFTHVYPDGPAPYFTVVAPSSPGSELSQWAEIKAAASEAVAAAGGTITHHHAVGRDHRPWYDRQRPDRFAAALRAAKAAVDPAGILNPGVLIDP